MSSKDIYQKFYSLSRELILRNTYDDNNVIRVKKIKVKKITDFGNLIIPLANECFNNPTLGTIYFMCTCVLNNFEPFCKSCGSFLSSTKNVFCSVKCRANDKDWQNGVSNTILRKTGYSWVSKNPKIKEQVQKSKDAFFFEKYGNSKLPHGFGSDSFKKGMLNIYGVENPSQNEKSFKKQQSHKNTFKIFTFDSGNSYNIQGYEDRAIQLLLDRGYKEQDFLLSNRPSIKYFWSSLDGYGDDKWHTYHPDIILINENKIIEVKSGWTFDGFGKRLNWLSKNLAKQNSSISQGWKHEFMII